MGTQIQLSSSKFGVTTIISVAEDRSRTVKVRLLSTLPLLDFLIFPHSPSLLTLLTLLFPSLPGTLYSNMLQVSTTEFSAEFTLRPSANQEYLTLVTPIGGSNFYYNVKLYNSPVEGSVTVDGTEHTYVDC